MATWSEEHVNTFQTLRQNGLKKIAVFCRSTRCHVQRGGWEWRSGGEGVSDNIKMSRKQSLLIDRIKFVLCEAIEWNEKN